MKAISIGRKIIVIDKENINIPGKKPKLGQDPTVHEFSLGEFCAYAQALSRKAAKGESSSKMK